MTTFGSGLASPTRPAERGSPPGQRLVVVAAAATFLAGALHLVLTDAQLRRWGAAGALLLALGLYEVLAGAALLAKPGARAYRAGSWGSGLIAAAYIASKVLPVPAARIPQPVSPLEIAVSVLDLAALLLLATVLPDPALRRRRRPAPWLAGLLVALATPVVWVFVTGALQWVDTAALPRPPAARLFWNPDRSGLITPALYGFVSDRLYLFLPWWAGVGAAMLGLFAGANVWLAKRLEWAGRISCRRARAGSLGLLPAAFAAPVCCGLPLAALFGLSTATLFAGAPFATTATIALLSSNLIWLAQRRRSVSGPDRGGSGTP